jgi:hypothetical protein
MFDITIKLEEWAHSFWRGPGGLLIISVAAIIIGAVFTKLTGLTELDWFVRRVAAEHQF